MWGMAISGEDKSIRGRLKRWWPHPARDMVANRALASAAIPPVVRGLALNRLMGLRIDRTASVSDRVWLGERDISIGAFSFVNRDCMIESGVQIGNWVQVAQGVRMITTTHEVEGSGHRAGAIRHERVSIEDGAWLGASVTVLPGVVIGRGCIVAAGAVVTKDCAPDGLYAGVPARRVKDLPQ